MLMWAYHSKYANLVQITVMRYEWVRAIFCCCLLFIYKQFELVFAILLLVRYVQH